LNIKLIPLNGTKLDEWEHEYEIYQKIVHCPMWVKIFSCHEAGGVGQTLAINQYTFLTSLEGDTEYRMYDRGTLI
jgi:hypothetical protein